MLLRQLWAFATLAPELFLCEVELNCLGCRLWPEVLLCQSYTLCSFQTVYVL